MPGLSVYVVGFNYKGYYYYWNVKQHCFISSDTEYQFNNIPVGAYNLVISRKDPEENEID